MARAIDLHLAQLANKAETDASSEPAASADEPSTDSGHGSNGYGNGNGNGNGLSNGGSHLPGLNPMMLAPYSVTGNLCTQCGNNTMRYEEGCKKCVSCGYSEC